MRFARPVVAGFLIAGLSLCAGCGSWRARETVLPSPSPSPSAPQMPSEAPAPSVDDSPPHVEPVSEEVSPAAPTCACIEAKPSKPKLKPKPKPVHKVAPPQLATAPVVAETPPGGVVDAQVKALNVPVMSILGKRVKGPAGQDLGRVVDVLADSTGRVRVAIIDFGGFLGVGNHRIAVDWPLLRFNPDGQDPSLLLSLSPEKLQAAPEYKDSPRPQALMEP